MLIPFGTRDGGVIWINPDNVTCVRRDNDEKEKDLAEIHMVDGGQWRLGEPTQRVADIINKKTA